MCLRVYFMNVYVNSNSYFICGTRCSYLMSNPEVCLTPPPPYSQLPFTNLHKISDFMTGGLLVSRKRKLELHKLAILNPSQVNLEKYKKFRNLFNSLVRASKKLHYNNQLSANKKNPKKLWDTLKTLTPGGNSNTTLNKIEANGKIINDKKEMAEEFNSFFTEAGKKIANSVNPIAHQPDNFVSPECPQQSDIPGRTSGNH